MPKTTKRTLKARMPSGDPVSIQFSITVRRPSGVKLTSALLSEMVRQKALGSTGQYDPKSGRTKGAKAGPNPRGVTLKIIRWRNPDRRGKLKAWRSGTQAEAWGSLRHAFKNANFNF